MFLAALLTVASPWMLLGGASRLQDGRNEALGPPVRGVTISCQTWGVEWGTDAFARELDRLAELGVNWIAIHPYAWIRGDGRLAWKELDTEAPPAWLARPIREAHARGMKLFVKPHVGYWGSPFTWHGDIDFPDPALRARFFADYERWIVAVARCTAGADGFSVGTELERLVGPADELAWRRIVALVRDATAARLTYCANWDAYAALPFWDALDAVGVQAYFPLAEEEDPDERRLEESWSAILSELRAVHERTGKPIVFTELGYNLSLAAAREPWAYATTRGPDAERAALLQERLLRVALRTTVREADWLHGAFLWKWFAGEAPRANFVLDREPLREAIRAWGG